MGGYMEIDANNAAEQLKSLAKSIVDSINATRDPNLASALLGTLAGIANIADAPAIVGSWLSECRTFCEHLESEINTEHANTVSEQQRLIAANIAKTEAVLASFEGRDIWAKGEKEYIDSIKADDRISIVKMDKDGKIMRDANGSPIMETISGQRLKESEAIAVGVANYDKLDDKGKAALNDLIYGDPRGADYVSPEIRKRGELRIEQATREVEGKMAADAHKIAAGANRGEEVTERASKRVERASDRVQVQITYARAMDEQKVAPEEQLGENKMALVQNGASEVKTEKGLRELQKMGQLERADDRIINEGQIHLVPKTAENKQSEVLRDAPQTVYTEQKNAALLSKVAPLTGEDRRLINQTAAMMAQLKADAALLSQGQASKDNMEAIRVSMAKNNVSLGAHSEEAALRLEDANIELNMLASLGPISDVPMNNLFESKNPVSISEKGNSLQELKSLSDNGQVFAVIDTQTLSKPLVLPDVGSRTAIGKV